MRGWKQGDMILAEQESRDYFDFISDAGIRGIYLSLRLLVLPNSNYSCSLTLRGKRK